LNENKVIYEFGRNRRKYINFAEIGEICIIDSEGMDASDTATTISETQSL